VEYRNHPQRLFVWRVGDDLFANQFEAERPGCEIWPSVTLMRKLHESADRRQYSFTKARGRTRVVVRDVFPDSGDVLRREWM
jgi:hypothetical protein